MADPLACREQYASRMPSSANRFGVGVFHRIDEPLVGGRNVGKIRESSRCDRVIFVEIFNPRNVRSANFHYSQLRFYVPSECWRALLGTGKQKLA
jgi:hypothetical protein